MSALSVVLLVLGTLLAVGLAKLSVGVFVVWRSGRLGLCGTCHTRAAEYWFNAGEPGAFAACGVCLDAKIGFPKRLRWVADGTLTRYVKREPDGAP